MNKKDPNQIKEDSVNFKDAKMTLFKQTYDLFSQEQRGCQSLMAA